MKYTGIVAPEILLPNCKDMSAWACVACDQFTGEPEYWQQLDKLTAGKPRALDLILPEAFLSEDNSDLIKQINCNITNYLANNAFTKLDRGYILTIRSTPYVERRIGLMALVDLDHYEYSSKSSSLIRATEGTVEERIPPRLKIRKDALIELPHVMVLFDDEKREIAEPLYQNRSQFKKVYDFDLNMNGGHIEGYFIPDSQEITEKFANLLDEQRLISKYGKVDNFAFAVGDGNHSLATAKAHWNLVKQGLTKEQAENHPAKYALAEFVNIYDEGIYFEPIYRFVKGVDVDKFLQGLNSIDCGNVEIYAKGSINKVLGNANLPEGIENTDAFIKDYITKFGGQVDYIHGKSNLLKLVDDAKNAVGILFEKLDKASLFKYVSEKGSFPRKTFSMGEGIEKRYYLEARKIK